MYVCMYVCIYIYIYEAEAIKSLTELLWQSSDMKSPEDRPAQRLISLPSWGFLLCLYNECIW